MCVFAQIVVSQRMCTIAVRVHDACEVVYVFTKVYYLKNYVYKCRLIDIRTKDYNKLQ